MSKQLTPLEALESIIDTFYDKNTEDIKIVRNALESLEIIKEKYKTQKMTTYDTKGNVICDKLIGMEPNKIILNLIFTKEEYDLLREELKK